MPTINIGLNRRDRLYAWMGFWSPRAQPSQQSFKGAIYLGSHAAWPLSWRERLLVLISGRVAVDMAHVVDLPPGVFLTNAAFGVLPPNYKAGPHGR